MFCKKINFIGCDIKNEKIIKKIIIINTIIIK